MQLSVVTIALNASKDLPLTIESVSGQDFDDFEYIVVDGLSWDSSFDIYKRYKKEIDRVLSVEDSGVYSAMNYAISQCRGKYILFMNAGDTFYSASALSNIFSFLQKNEDPDIIFGDHVYVDKGLELHKRSLDFSLTRKALLEGELSHKWHDQFPCHQATLTKRDLLTRLNGYDTRFEICADHDFLLRAFDAGATTKYVDETVAHYFGGGMSAQRGDRCRFEWVQVYRSRCRYPQEVDKFFRASDFVRYDTQSEETGSKLLGFHGLEGPYGHDMNFMYSWCEGDGFSMVSPRHSESIGLFLEGENKFENQRLTLTSEGRTLGQVSVPVGWFEIDVPFASALAPQSIVEVLPARGVILPNDGRFVSLLLKHFHFDTFGSMELKPLALGATHNFGFDTIALLEPLLQGGWSHVETSHVWSTGPSSHLQLPFEQEPEEVVVVIGGNPYVPAERRTVSVSVNGKPVAEAICLSTDPQELRLQIAKDAWKPFGHNYLTFIVDETAAAPNDPRDLGVCLYSIAAGRTGAT